MWNNQQVAVKTFIFGDSERNSIKWHMTTVAREAILTFGMDHPNVCKLLGCGFGQNCVFLVLEYAGDATKAEPRFAALLDQSVNSTEFPSRDFLVLLRDIAAGLAYVHNMHHVIHRDIQLQNVLIHRDGRAMVADWGQAKVRSRALRPTQFTFLYLIISSGSGGSS
jgi:serine/threonine protein kinase